jgi:ribosome modulation factor
MHVFSALDDTDSDNGNSKFWKEGFEAGKVLNSRCPYRAGSPQARDWLEGWVAGIHEPVERVQVQEEHEKPPAGRWRAWLRSLLGR